MYIYVYTHTHTHTHTHSEASMRSLLIFYYVSFTSIAGLIYFYSRSLSLEPVVRGS